MNPTANSTGKDVAGALVVAKTGRIELYLIAIAMLAYPALIGLASGPVGGAIAIVAATMAYTLSIFTHYGVARLAFTGHNYLLWGCAVAAFVIGYAITGIAGLWMILATWGLILFAGVFVGRLSATGANQLRVYLIGHAVALCFAFALYYPQFEIMMDALASQGVEQIGLIEKGLIQLGYGADAVRQNLESLEKAWAVMVRLLPATLVLSATVPFSIGYLWFNTRIDEKNYPGRTVVPFVRWKMPAGFAPVVVVVSLFRFFGNEPVRMAADNIIAFLGFYYLVAGFAAIDFYFRRYLPNILRWTFYAAFFLFQFSGTIVALALLLAVIILGFLDSFLDWRKVQQLSLKKK